MRLDRIRYPDGRYVHYTYGADDSIPDKLSRVDAITNNNAGEPEGTSYAAYTYCGGGRLVVESFTQPELRLDYWGQAGTTYVGFDRFGRIQQQLWHDHTGGGGGTDREKFTYGYDRNSNRMYRKNELKTDFSELYHTNGENNGYDGLSRLTEFRRGTLHAGNRSITDHDKRRQIFTLDQVGNWAGFQDAAGAGGQGNWDLEQTRDNNDANEIEDIDMGGTGVSP